MIHLESHFRNIHYISNNIFTLDEIKSFNLEESLKLKYILLAGVIDKKKIIEMVRLSGDDLENGINAWMEKNYPYKPISSLDCTKFFKDI